MNGKYIFIFCTILISANSCFVEKQAEFYFDGTSGEHYPLYTSSNKLSGTFDLSKTKHYYYSLQESIRVPRNCSLEIDYSFESIEPAGADIANGADSKTAGKKYQIILKIDDDSGWTLPADLSFLAIDKPSPRIRYAIPLQTARIKKISFEIKGVKKPDVKLRLETLRMTERFYGFDAENDAVLTSPFVKREYGQTEDAALILISPDENYELTGARTLFMDGIKDAPEITAGGDTFYYIANTGGNDYNSLTIPAAFLISGEETVQINGYADTAIVKMDSGDEFGAETRDTGKFEPITADPGFVLLYPKEAWRGEEFEIFRWESFPNILIFDTSSYDFQDKLFKRIAFFAEKKGFKGRLASDDEIAELHGWNAHDYNAETLARFFDGAEKSSFPLNAEELALRSILIESNIIKKIDGNFTGGGGAVISISRESEGYLRALFMTHEAFHGIFFIDADFREFCKQRWDNLDNAAKRFITSYFDFQQYDINDSFLVLNEFMAHCLQQGVSASGKYFGENLANRMYEKSPWRRATMPPRDEAAGNWPGLAESFKRETIALSDYAMKRWGLAAGRVWRVRS
ncbi:MAG: hypothetical protein LBB22_03175 [Treponema sp.]|jgi:hypothetical protein|nr:hypothetical protein [Treponema sp.]